MKKGLSLLYLRFKIVIINVVVFILANVEGYSFEKIMKQKHSWVMEVKRYHISDIEPITLFGGKEKKFFNENWYWGEAGYGAISGKRGGYLEGGIIFGRMQTFKAIVTDIRFFTGAGGGSSAPQGGGFIMNPTIGVGFKTSKKISIMIELGYIKFLNGNIESPTVGLNMHYDIWNIFSK